jgi:dTMP kinase
VDAGHGRERDDAAPDDKGATEVSEPLADEPTAPLAQPPDPLSALPDVARGRPALHVRLFGSHQFFRLWLAQVVSATGDWLGFLAIAVLATRVSDNPEAAVGLVLSARIVPGFFFASVAGVLVDRWDRKKVMVVCDLGRAAVLVTLPFVNSVSSLVLASLVLEVFTLLWSPAKEASVPNLVPPDNLTTANSLSLVAAYGTFPIASLLFAALASIGSWLSGFSALDVLQLDNQESLAFYADVVTFMISALMISTLQLPSRPRREVEAAKKRRLDFGQTFHDLKEGWRYIFFNHTVRGVNLGLAVALIGGGMLVPLGPVFSIEVLDAGEAGFGLFITALGLGVAAGVVAVSALQKRLPKARAFAGAVYVAGASLLAGASMSSFWLSATFVFIMGSCAGAVYVLGFTLLHENVVDELRGRIFSALYTLVRLCILLSFALGPFLAALMDEVSMSLFDGEIEVLGLTIGVPGVRITLWLAGVIILIAGYIASRALRAGERAQESAVADPRPDTGGAPA